MTEAAVKQSVTKGVKRRNERNILTFYEKIAVIRYYDETNISRNSLAKMFHCCATQIRRILERKKELLQQLATLSEADASIILEEMTRKRRKFEMSAISFILHQWVERCRQLNVPKPITNETLKETALRMAAILNLPSFRPSYRWLNRFRGRYKYNDQDLSTAADADASGNGQPAPQLTVEDIIIEFKDALPSFMQKEISAITANAKVEEKPPASVVSGSDGGVPPNSKNNENASSIRTTSTENSIDSVDSEDDDVIEVDMSNAKNESPSDAGDELMAKAQPPAAAQEPNEPLNLTDELNAKKLTAGSAALLSGIFPHLAVIHQFALLNSDVKALELISQLGVHMQTQASTGAYKKLTLANANVAAGDELDGGIYGDIDDIVLIE